MQALQRPDDRVDRERPGSLTEAVVIEPIDSARPSIASGLAPMTKDHARVVRAIELKNLLSHANRGPKVWISDRTEDRSVDPVAPVGWVRQVRPLDLVDVPEPEPLLQLRRIGLRHCLQEFAESRAEVGPIGI